MKISIALPSYNYAQFLLKCLESIQMQDHIDYEVLIADGGSTDGSVEIIKEFCLHDSRFRLVSTEDKGQSDGIVKVFGYASGEVFCFLNADDCYLCSDALSSVVDAFINHPNVDILNFGGTYIDANGKYIKPVKLRYHPLDNIALMKYRTAVLQPSTFWSKKVYETVPMFIDSHYVFDAVFFYQAYIKYSWLELSKPISGHRLHGANKSLRINCDRIEEIAKFESLKFGSWSLRVVYLLVIYCLVKVFGRFPIVGSVICRALYLTVNSIAFLSCYRLPGI